MVRDRYCGFGSRQGFLARWLPALDRECVVVVGVVVVLFLVVFVALVLFPVVFVLVVRGVTAPTAGVAREAPDLSDIVNSVG
jgi:hypothetical protein